MNDGNEFDILKQSGEATEEIETDSIDEIIRLFGVFDENLKIIEEETGARIRTNDGNVYISGAEESVALAKTVTDKLLSMLRKGEAIDRITHRATIATNAK